MVPFSPGNVVASFFTSARLWGSPVPAITRIVFEVRIMPDAFAGWQNSAAVAAVERSSLDAIGSLLLDSSSALGVTRPRRTIGWR